VARFVSAALAEGPEKASTRLLGHYFLVMVDSATGETVAFVDAGGFYRAYTDGLRVSDSLFALAPPAMHFSDISLDAMAEFATYGAVHGGDTLLPSVRLIDGDEILHRSSSESEPWRRITKASPMNGSGAFGATAMETFEPLIAAYGNATLGVDLTGGIDSRLLALLVRARGHSFETAISGASDLIDVSRAREVARRMGTPFHVTVAGLPANLEESLRELFEATEGAIDVLAVCRPWQHQVARRERGCALAVSGAGGELFKDFWWLQDFPFYRSRRVRLARLLRLRMQATPAPVWLWSETFRQRVSAAERKLLSRLEKYREETNTQTYDRIYHAVRMRAVAGALLTFFNQILPCHAPFLEPAAYRLGYHLPRRRRFYAWFHRELITRLDPYVAAAPTTEGGMSVSSVPWRVCFDGLRYLIDKGRRLAKKLGQRLFRKTYFQESADHPQLRERTRESALFRAAVDRLRGRGILADDVKPNDVPDSMVGRVLTLGLAIERFERS
jgi:hypothetical protein